MLPVMSLSSIACLLLSCLLLSPVQGEDAGKEKLNSLRISCPKGSLAYASNCYALFKTGKSWFDAELACQKRSSGHLVSVLSGSEASFVSSLVKSTANNCQYIWMGLHDPTSGQESNGDGWEWSNNDVLNYVNWERNPSTASNRGFCGSLTGASQYRKWRDYNCDASLPYICKFKA